MAVNVFIVHQLKKKVLKVIPTLAELRDTISEVHVICFRFECSQQIFCWHVTGHGSL